MLDLNHNPSDSSGARDAHAAARHRRYGLVLFAIYLVIYSGFVWLNAFRPELAEVPLVAGINVAIVYGFGLIIAAFVLAIFYGWLCRSTRGSDPGTKEAGE